MLRVKSVFELQKRFSSTCCNLNRYSHQPSTTGGPTTLPSPTERVHCQRRFVENLTPRYFPGEYCLPGNLYDNGKKFEHRFVNWFKLGYCTACRNQGYYGTCYACALAAAIEISIAIFSGKKKRVAAQEVVDHEYFSCGIYSGHVCSGLDFVAARRGLCSSHDYPYRGFHESREAWKFQRFGKILGYQRLPFNDVDLFFEILLTQPIICGMRVSDAFRDYKGEGIIKTPYFSEQVNDKINLEVQSRLLPNATKAEIQKIYEEVREMVLIEEMCHAVVMLGVEKENGEKYVSGVNSWGTGYGLEGLFNMSVHSAKTHGIFENGAIPIFGEVVARIIKESGFSRLDMRNLVSARVR